jgi:phage repressor protein C with HTH and peptisase S24 domain
LPSAENLVKIANYLNISVDWLLSGEGSMLKNSDDIDNEETELLTGFNRLEKIEKSMVLERTRTLVELKEAAERETREAKDRDKREKAEKAAVEREVPEEERRAGTHLHSGEPEEEDEEPDTVKKKVYNEPAAAGAGVELSEHSDYELMEFRADEVPDSADYGVRIVGDSMEPLLRNGDIVWVEHDTPVESGGIGIFYIDTGAVCKKFYTDYETLANYLISINPKYPPIKITEYNFRKTIGKVIL